MKFLRFDIVDPVRYERHDSGLKGSEWTKEFRDKVNQAWLVAIEDYHYKGRFVRSTEIGERLAEIKERLAGDFKLEREELAHILEASD